MLFGLVKRLVLSGRGYVAVAQVRQDHRFLLSSLLLGVAVNFAVAGESAFPVSGRVKSVVEQYCVACHDNELKKGGLDLESISGRDIREHSDEWEKVLRKLRARQMPPIGKERPPDKTYDEVVAWLASSLDRAAAERPNPGRTETFHRLNRTEYQNAIRGLLSLDVDAATLLPKDDVSQGFDNVSAANLSPTLLNQ